MVSKNIKKYSYLSRMDREWTGKTYNRDADTIKEDEKIFDIVDLP
jgi:hypothetical protein